MRALWIVLAICCATPAFAGDEKVLYTNHRVDFVKIKDMDKKEVKERAVNHPAEITEAKMRDYLAAVTFRRKEMFKKVPVMGRVFNDRAVEVLAPVMAKALSQAQANQMVVFSWLFKDPLMIIRNDMITAGDLWVSDGMLHLKFNKLLAQMTGDYDTRGGLDFAVNNAKSVNTDLISSPGVIVAGKGNKQAIVDMSADFTVAAEGASPDGFGVVTADKTKQTATRSAKNRLNDLDQLRKDKMVTEQEYQAKRKLILRDL